TSGRKGTVSDGDPSQHSPVIRRLLGLLRDHADRGKMLTFNRIVGDMTHPEPEVVPGGFGSDQPITDLSFFRRATDSRVLRDPWIQCPRMNSLREPKASRAGA